MILFNHKLTKFSKYPIYINAKENHLLIKSDFRWIDITCNNNSVGKFTIGCINYELIKF